jgi:hypothetical protein
LLSEKVKHRELFFLIPYLLFILFSFFFLGTSSHSVKDFPLDDAWIHRVYARSLAWGEGLSYNLGEPETGATSPLWILLTAPVHWLEPIWPDAPVVGIKVIGGMLGVLSISLVILITRTLTGGIRIPLITASIWAVEPRLIFSSYGGMEVNLFVVIFLGLIWADLTERKIGTYLFLSLLPVCRPEGLLVLLIYGLRDVFLWWTQGNRIGFLDWVWVLIPFSLWTMICQWISGLYLPLPFYQKAQWVWPSFSLLLKMWQLQSHHGPFPGLVFAFSIVSFGFLCFQNRSFPAVKTFLPFVLVPTVFLLGIILSRSISLDGYYWLRYADPADLMMMIAATIGLAIWADRIGRWRVWIREIPKGDRHTLGFLKGNLPLLAGVLLVCSLPHWWQSIEAKRFHLWSDGKIIHLMNVEVGKWLKAHTPAQVSVGVNDAGAIRYFSDRRIVDLLGLNNRDVVLKRVSVKDLINRVDWIALYPVWFRKYNLKAFELRQVFAVNPESYSLCNCPTQTLLTIAERRKGVH